MHEYWQLCNCFIRVFVAKYFGSCKQFNKKSSVAGFLKLAFKSAKAFSLKQQHIRPSC